MSFPYTVAHSLAGTGTRQRGGRGRDRGGKGGGKEGRGRNGGGWQRQSTGRRARRRQAHRRVGRQNTATGAGTTRNEEGDGGTATARVCPPCTVRLAGVAADGRAGVGTTSAGASRGRGAAGQSLDGAVPRRQCRPGEEGKGGRCVGPPTPPPPPRATRHGNGARWGGGGGVGASSGCGWAAACPHRPVWVGGGGPTAGAAASPWAPSAGPLWGIGGPPGRPYTPVHSRGGAAVSSARCNGGGGVDQTGDSLGARDLAPVLYGVQSTSRGGWGGASQDIDITEAELSSGEIGNGPLAGGGRGGGGRRTSWNR